MEGQLKGLLMGILGIVILALIVNVGIQIYAPHAVSNAIKATTNSTYTVDGTEYQFTGTGETAQVAGQEVQDNINLIRVIANVLFGVVFLLLVILSIVSLIKSGKRG